MKTVLLGSTGKLGSAWRRLGQDRDDLDITDGPGREQVDLAVPGALEFLPQHLGGTGSELIIHAAAWTDVDGCERDADTARRVNTDSVAAIADTCKRNGTGLLFYSTDYVFDGTGPRGEEDDTRPLNVYGRTKTDAEEIIRSADIPYLIVRINVPLAPPAHGKSFYSFLLEHLSAGTPVRIVTDQWNNPLDTGRIVRWSWEAWQNGVRGTLHLGGGTYATRYDIARMVADYVGADHSLIEPITTASLSQAAPRPTRGGLLISRQTELFGTAPDLPTILQALPDTAGADTGTGTDTDSATGVDTDADTGAPRNSQ